MTYPDNSFQMAKDFYNQAMRFKELGQYDDARSNFQLAKTIFQVCSGQHPKAAEYLKWIEQELKELGE
jgi:hypothetical protein